MQYNTNTTCTYVSLDYITTPANIDANMLICRDLCVYGIEQFHYIRHSCECFGAIVAVE